MSYTRKGNGWERLRARVLGHRFQNAGRGTRQGVCGKIGGGLWGERKAGKRTAQGIDASNTAESFSIILARRGKQREEPRGGKPYRKADGKGERWSKILGHEAADIAGGVGDFTRREK